MIDFGIGYFILLVLAIVIIELPEGGE